MRKHATALLVVIAALAITSPAQAHLVAHPKCHTLHCIEVSQVENLKHAKYVCKHGAHAHKRWSCRAVVWLTREYKKTEKALHPTPIYTASGYAPLCGSSCVSCESGHDPNNWDNLTGNTYWGWYQFDYGTWKAHGGVPSHWGNSHTSAAEQTAVAARVRYDAWPNC